jgi:hypothetical protein
MKKIYIESEVLKSAVDTVSLASSDKAVVLMNIGVRVKDDSMLSTITVLGGSNQASSAIEHKAPADAKGVEDQYMTLAFKAKEFFTIVGSLLSDNGRIFIESDDKVCHVGIDKVAKATLEVIPKESVPAAIPVKNDEIIMQAQVKVNALFDALRIGAAHADPNANAEKGTGNAIFRFVYEESDKKGIPGTLQIYSTDGKAMSRGTCKCAITNDPVFTANAKKYCEAKGIEDVCVAIPKKSISDIFKAAAGYETVIFNFTEKHCHIALGSSSIFVFTTGSTICKAVFHVDEWANEKRPVVLVVDTDTFGKRLEFLNKINDLSGKADPIIIKVERGKPLSVTLSSKKSGEAKIETVGEKFEEGAEEKFEVALAGKYVTGIISNLKKGNCRIAIYPGDRKNPVEFANGDLNMKSMESIAYLFTVLTPSGAKAKTEEEFDGEKTTEEETPDGEAATEEVTE